MMKYPGDFSGGLLMFGIMFTITLLQIHVFKNVRAFSACACANGHCVGQCNSSEGRGNSVCACANGHCVGDCNGKGKGSGGRSKKGSKSGGGGGKSKQSNGGGGRSKQGGEEESEPAQRSTPAASKKPAAPKPTTAAPKTSNCSCMPMDSDPSRQKIETPEGVDCANHEYPGSVEECEALLATVADSPCCQGGSSGANLAVRTSYMARVRIA